MKFVLKDRGDYDYARDVIAATTCRTRLGAVLLSPVHGVLDPRALVGMGAGRSSAGARAAAAAQVHLVAGHAWGLSDARARRGCSALSGGLDSYTAAAIAKAEGFTLDALTILYGQRHAQEIAAARRWRPRSASSGTSSCRLDLRPSADRR